MAKIFNNDIVNCEQGSLNGNYEDCLNYLSWVINVRANRYFKVEQKGEAFFNAIKTLKEKFGVNVSTHFLKQLSNLEHGKMLHILYMLRIGGFLDNSQIPAKYMVNPSKMGFKGFVSIKDGKRGYNPKILDFLIFPDEWKEQKARENKFKVKCEKEWKEYAEMLEKEEIEANKLKIVSTLEEKPINYEELEEVSPHLIKKDIALMPKIRVKQGYH